MVVCKMDMEGKTDAKIEAIWDDWRKKRSKNKIADAYAEIILRVKDSQLMHRCSHDPKIVWDTLTQVYHAHGLVTWLVLWRLFLTSVKGVEEAMSAWVGP
jgi:hypothetical protein